MTLTTPWGRFSCLMSGFRSMAVDCGLSSFYSTVHFIWSALYCIQSDCRNMIIWCHTSNNPPTHSFLLFSCARMSVSVYRFSLGALGVCTSAARALVGSQRAVKVPSRGLFGSKQARPGKSQSRVLSKDEGHLFELESEATVILCEILLWLDFLPSINRHTHFLLLKCSETSQ